ncbi:MAG TPA: amino acid ABC transporter substrate-binding protein [Stellaceae bacterium]|nr:amino acid ABC transporter substrate-binding protein [Stellaceae bacterium]
MHRRDVIRGLSAGLVAGGIAAPFVSRAAAQSGKTLVFGGSVPLSGAAAETGLNVNNGYITAVDYLNEHGGVEIGGEKYQLKLSLFDDASDPSRAVTLIQRQLDEGTQFFLGSFGSNIVLPTAAVVERAGKLMVQTGGGSDQIFTKGYKNIFGMYPRASRQTRSTPEFFKGLKPEPRSISVVLTNDAFSKTSAQGMVNDCKAAGFEVLGTYELPEKVTDVSSVLAAIRAKTPDILACVTHDQDSLLIARQMIATGTNVKLLLQELGPQLASYRESLGKYAEGICVHTYWEPDAPFKGKFFPTAAKFAEYYHSKFTRPITYHVAGAAACIVTYILAMQDAKSTEPAKVRDALAKADYETFYGRIKFTPDGDGDPLLMGPSMAQVQKGKLELVFPENARTAPTIYPVPPWDKKA